MEKPGKKLNKFLKNLPYYFPAIVFFISLSFNLLYFDWQNAPVLFPDSGGYIQFADRISQWQKPDIFGRTPTYPLYLLLLFENLKLATIGQIVIGTFSSVLLYLIGLQLLKRPWPVFFAVIVVSADYAIARFNSFILTENLSIFLLLLSLCLHILVLTGNAAKKIFIAAIVADILLIFVRPNLMFLPIIFFLFTFCYFIIFEKKDAYLKKIRTFVFFGIILNITLISGYCYANYLQSGYFTISRLTDIAILGKILQYDMVRENTRTETMPDAAKKVIGIQQELQKKMEEMKNENESANEPKLFSINYVPSNSIKNILINGLKFVRWGIIYPSTTAISMPLHKYLNEDQYKSNPYDIYNSLSRQSKNYLDEMKTANAYFLKNNYGEFFLKTMRNTPKVMMIYGSDSSLLEKYNNNKLLSFAIKTGFFLFEIITIISPLAILISIFYFLWFVFKKNKEKIAILGTILLAILYVVFNISALGYGDYSRLRMPVIPLIELLVFLPLLILTEKIFRFLFSRPNMTE